MYAFKCVKAWNNFIFFYIYVALYFLPYLLFIQKFGHTKTKIQHAWKPLARCSARSHRVRRSSVQIGRLSAKYGSPKFSISAKNCVCRQIFQSVTKKIFFAKIIDLWQKTYLFQNFSICDKNVFVGKIFNLWQNMYLLRKFSSCDNKFYFWRTYWICDKTCICRENFGLFLLKVSIYIFGHNRGHVVVTRWPLWLKFSRFLWTKLRRTRVPPDVPALFRTK